MTLTVSQHATETQSLWDFQQQEQDHGEYLSPIFRVQLYIAAEINNEKKIRQ